MKRLLTFLQSGSIRAESEGKQPIQSRNPPPPGPRRKIGVFGPDNEAIQDRSVRYFGKWKPNKGDPSRFARREEPASGEENVLYTKFYGSTDFRIEAKKEPKSQTTVWDFAKIAFEKAFGIKIE